MKKDVIFILDRSGSMAGLESDTIGGFNGLLKKQKEVDGDVFISTVLFDDHIEWLDERCPLQEMDELNNETYYVRGTTALLDAIGSTLTKMSKTYQKMKTEKPEKVMVVIVTDGLENASTEYSLKVVKTLVHTFQEEAKWEFLFLGANIDAVETGASLGINRKKTANYHADGPGVLNNFNTLDKAMNEFRVRGKVSENWKDDIDRDYKERKK
jgi:uncharacterized protein YegL